MPRKRLSNDICYLCGKQIESDRTREHIVPRSWIPDGWQARVQLPTLPAHQVCNKSYESDEDYVRVAALTLSERTQPEEALWEVVGRGLDRRPGLGLRVASQFQTRTKAGIELPAGRVIWNREAHRIRRVLWKITLGIFAKYGDALTPTEPMTLRAGLITPEEFQSDSEVWMALIKKMERSYLIPGVFWFGVHVQNDTTRCERILLMRFWQGVMAVVAFHDETCRCVICQDDTNSTGTAPQGDA